MINGLIKEFRIFFRDRTVLATLLFTIFIGITVIEKSVSVIPSSDISYSYYFRFFQQHMMIMIFPAVLINIMTAAFSVTSEKQSSMLSKLLPNGECLMVRSKVMFCMILSSVMSFSYILAVTFSSSLDIFPDFRFLIFISASFLFLFSGLSSFTVYFAFRRFDGTGNYEPDVKTMLMYMLAVTLIVTAFYFFLSVSFNSYFNYMIGFRIGYPNLEFSLFLLSVFIFHIIARYLLNSAEKKLSEGLI